MARGPESKSRRVKNEEGGFFTEKEPVDEADTTATSHSHSQSKHSSSSSGGGSSSSTSTSKTLSRAKALARMDRQMLKLLNLSLDHVTYALKAMHLDPNFLLSQFHALLLKARVLLMIQKVNAVAVAGGARSSLKIMDDNSLSMLLEKEAKDSLARCASVARKNGYQLMALVAGENFAAFAILHSFHFSFFSVFYDHCLTRLRFPNTLSPAVEFEVLGIDEPYGRDLQRRCVRLIRQKLIDDGERERSAEKSRSGGAWQHWLGAHTSRPSSAQLHLHMPQASPGGSADPLAAPNRRHSQNFFADSYAVPGSTLPLSPASVSPKHMAAPRITIRPRPLTEDELLARAGQTRSIMSPAVHALWSETFGHLLRMMPSLAWLRPHFFAERDGFLVDVFDVEDAKLKLEERRQAQKEQEAKLPKDSSSSSSSSSYSESDDDEEEEDEEDEEDEDEDEQREGEGEKINGDARKDGAGQGQAMATEAADVYSVDDEPFVPPPPAALALAAAAAAASLAAAKPSAVRTETAAEPETVAMLAPAVPDSAATSPLAGASGRSHNSVRSRVSDRSLTSAFSAITGDSGDAGEL